MNSLYPDTGIEPETGHKWFGDITSVSMEDEVLVGSSQTIEVETWRDKSLGHTEFSPDSCWLTFPFTVGVEIDVRVLIDGQEIERMSKCTGDDSALGSASEDTFQMSHPNPDQTGTYTYAVELLSGDTGEVEDRFETVLSVVEGASADLGIVDVSVGSSTVNTGDTVNASVVIENAGEEAGQSDLVAVYKGSQAARVSDFALRPGQEEELTFDFLAGVEEGTFDLVVSYGGSQRTVPITVEKEDDGGNGGGDNGGDDPLNCPPFSAFTRKECCPIHFTIDTPTRWGNIDPPNICLLSLAGGVAGILILAGGAVVARVPLSILLFGLGTAKDATAEAASYVGDRPKLSISMLIVALAISEF